MTEEIQNQDPPEVKENDAELNLARQRKMYEKKLQAEAAEKQKLEGRLSQLEQMLERVPGKKSEEEDEEEEDDFEPYVDKKKFKKTLTKFGEMTEQKTQKQIQQAVNDALENERRQNYLKENADFNEVLTDENAEKFANAHPGLANSILKMPESFERQKLVYENIKALGLTKAENKSGVQDKVNQNRQHPGYQPTGYPGGAYSNQSDFSKSGQKMAYDKMKELQKKLRIN